MDNYTETIKTKKLCWIVSNILQFYVNDYLYNLIYKVGAHVTDTLGLLL